jgi:hypothetical protein
LCFQDFFLPFCAWPYTKDPGASVFGPDEYDSTDMVFEALAGDLLF